MKIVFAGTPDFARDALQALLDAGHRIALVLTQPDRPAGRGMKLQASPVKQLAQAKGINVCQPRSLRLDGKYPEDAQRAQEALREAAADMMVVAAYGLILPAWVLQGPRLGCLNIHASLLPRWRGAAPIHRAIEAGDTETGITIMQMDEGLDTGAMLMHEILPISREDTSASLHDKLALLGGQCIVRALAQIGSHGLSATPQPIEGVSYAAKISKAEATIDWRQPASLIERRVRAFDPFPGASTQLADTTIKIWGARIAPPDNPDQLEPGRVLSAGENGIVVACGEGALQLTELQRAGGKRLSAAAFLAGFPIEVGSVLAAAPSSPVAP